jgi:hypothetical protein
MAFQRKKPAAIGVKAPFPGFIEPELATSVDNLLSVFRVSERGPDNNLPNRVSCGRRLKTRPNLSLLPDSSFPLRLQPQLYNLYRI